MEPLVSIIIPVYNTGALAKTVTKQLLEGRYQNLEIIIIDDGSQDNSIEIIKSIKDKRVKVFHQENQGRSVARNFGIEKAAGEYIIFVDSDDEVDPDFVSKMAHRAQMQKTDGLVVCSFKNHFIKNKTFSDAYTSPITPKSSHETKNAFILRLLYSDGRMYPVFNKIFCTNIIKQNKIFFDTKMDFAEDTKFVLDYLKHVSIEMDFILEPLYIYNVGTATSSSNESSKNWQKWQVSYNNLKKWLGKKVTQQEKNRLRLVYLRWRYTWLAANIKGQK